MASLSDWVSFLNNLTTLRLGPFIDKIVIEETLYPVKVKIPIPIPLPVNLGNIDLNPLDDLPDPPNLAKIPRLPEPQPFVIKYVRPTIEITLDLPPFELPTFSLPDFSALQNLTFGNVQLTFPTITFVQKSVNEPNSAISPPDDFIIAPFSFEPIIEEPEESISIDNEEDLRKAAELDEQRKLAAYEGEQERNRQILQNEQERAIAANSLSSLGYPTYSEIFQESIKIREQIQAGKKELEKPPPSTPTEPTTPSAGAIE